MSEFVVRKPEVCYTTKTFRFPQRLVQRLESVAAENGISVNELARQAINYALDDMKEADDGRK